MFTLRQDQNGYRPVFQIKNELGECPIRCAFCNVKKSGKASPEENVRLFEEQYEKLVPLIDGSYHPVIYNGGNVTNPEECSREVLAHILNKFNGDRRVGYISLNSRERYATPELLDWITNSISYPVHFIFGVESFSPRTTKLLGKNTQGELAKFINKLRPYNRGGSKPYVFGLDVNLLFLPELYVNEGEPKNPSKTIDGIRQDLRTLLNHTDPDVPLEVNIHPFCRVQGLPYEDADLDLLMGILQSLQIMIEDPNQHRNHKTHLFVGMEGEGYNQETMIQRWKLSIDRFNKIGII